MKPEARLNNSAGKNFILATCSVGTTFFSGPICLSRMEDTGVGCPKAG